MEIKGTVGYCEGNVKSATYSRNQREDMITDANTIGLTLDINEHRVIVLDSDDKITGEWYPDFGGILTWE